MREFGGPDALEVKEVERPKPIPTEVLVRVTAAGINPADWKTRERGGRREAIGDPPMILGWDVAGTVEEVGGGVTRFAPRRSRLRHAVVPAPRQGQRRIRHRPVPAAGARP